MHTICMVSRELQTEARAVGALLRRMGITQEFLANRFNVSQSQISRVLGGRLKRRTHLFEQLRSYAYQMHKRETSIDLSADSEIADAVAALWDGTPNDARTVATVIRSLSLLRADSTEGLQPTSSEE